MAGKIALVDRGTCGFAVKVEECPERRRHRRRRREQRAGAASGDGAASIRRSRSRPLLIIVADTATLIKGELARDTVNVTLKQNRAGRLGELATAG